MKMSLMEILRCPICKTELELKVDREEGDEIIEGTLTCTQCGHPYRIEDGIPDLLPPETR